MSRRKIIEPAEFALAEPLVELQRLEGERVEVGAHVSPAPGARACSSARTTPRSIVISWRGQCRKHGVAVYCLLPDTQLRSSHSRPRPRGGARARARREAPALFVDTINARLRVTGYLFQALFGSVAMTGGA